MTTEQAITSVELAAYLWMAAFCCHDWRGRRAVPSGWLTASFVVLAAAVGAGLLRGDDTAASGLLIATVVALLLFPWTLLQFSRAFSRPSRGLDRAALVVTIALLIATVVFPGVPNASEAHLSLWKRIYVVAFAADWAALAAVAARRLWRSGEGEPTVARRRMRSLSTGVFVLAGVIALSAATSPKPPLYAQIVIHVAGFAGALLLFAGVRPPAAVRTRWRREEAAAFEQTEAELMTVANRCDVIAVVLPSAIRMLGGVGAFLTDRDMSFVAVEGDVTPDVDTLIARAGRLAPTDLLEHSDLVAVAAHGGWLGVRRSATTPLFGREEIGRLIRLGRLTDLALQRVDLMERERAARNEAMERERQLQEAQEIAHLGSFARDVATGRLHLSDEMRRLLGHELGPSPHVDDVAHIVHPDDQDGFVAATRKLSYRDGAVDFRFRVSLPDGHIRWLRGRAAHSVDEQGTELVLGTAQDVTCEVAAEEALRDRERQLAEAQHLARLGSWSWDLNCRTGQWSAELHRLYGTDPDTFEPTFEASVARIHADDRNATTSAVERALRDHQPFEIVHRIIRTDGEVRWLRSQGHVALDDAGLIVRMFGTGQDITEQKRAEDALAHQALHDPLTGLPNRGLFLDRLRQAIVRRSRRPSSLVVMFLDLDRFKWVNDSLGHAVGDELILETGRRLVRVARGGDTVARFGGDEFLIMCEDVDGEHDAIALAERFAAAVAQPIELAGAEITPTASIGIALAASDQDVDANTLVRHADAAMYQAKDKGRHRYEVFAATTAERVTERLHLESSLRRAINEDQLKLHYQPIVDVSAGRVVGVEALVRWQHPTRGLIAPAEFIPIAEETGLIVPLGTHVLETACESAQSWQQSLGAPLSVSVNLSGRQLLAPNLQDCVDRVLSSSGLDPRLLCLEITETVLLDDAPGAARALRALKELGVSIAVDDFGTGYSSLTYLKRFSLDVLKIDRSFVSGLGHDREDRAIVMSVVDLAHAFGIVTVAEGVETVDQLDVLKRLGCEQAQGFHWTRALPSDAALGWMLDLARSTELAPERATGRTVLVVEDDASVRQLVRFALEDGPLIEVCEARDGREGVVMAGQFQPDVVLLDLAMPEMGGLEALPLIRAVAPRSRVIVLSGLDAEDLPGRATYEGAAAYWRKDMDLSRLAERLEPFLAAS